MNFRLSRTNVETEKKLKQQKSRFWLKIMKIKMCRQKYLTQVIP